MTGVAGIVGPSNPTRHGVLLADVIVELGFADRETVDRVEQLARESERTVESILLDSGTVDEVQLAQAIAERNGLDFVDLDSFEVDMAAARMIGASTAHRYRSVPIAFAPDGALIVAAQDPFDSLGGSDIEVITKSEVRRVIAAPTRIQALIEKLPEAPAPPPPAPLASVPPPAAPVRAPVPEPVAVAPRPPASPPDPPPGEIGDLSAELRALQETARRADALAVTVGRRIGELEEVDARAKRLEEQQAAAQERIAELERKLAGVVGAAEELRATTETLRGLQRVLEQSAG